MPQNRYRGPPMTLANRRKNGVRSIQKKRMPRFIYLFE
jgi:hypothetical protein